MANTRNAVTAHVAPHRACGADRCSCSPVANTGTPPRKWQPRVLLFAIGEHTGTYGVKAWGSRRSFPVASIDWQAGTQMVITNETNSAYTIEGLADTGGHLTRVHLRDAPVNVVTKLPHRVEQAREESFALEEQPRILVAHLLIHPRENLFHHVKQRREHLHKPR